MIVYNVFFCAIFGAITANELPSAIEYGKSNVLLMLADGRSCRVDYFHFLNDTSEFHGDNSKLITTEAIKNNIYHWFKLNYTQGSCISDISNGIQTQLSHYNPIKFRISTSCSRDFERYRTAIVVDGDGLSELQINDMKLVKFNGSSFQNYIIDEYTKLAPTPDRPLFLKLSVSWHDGAVSPNDMASIISSIFHSTLSQSVQHLVQLMAERITVRPLKFRVRNLHYIKLSENAFSPLQNEYGEFTIKYSARA